MLQTIKSKYWTWLHQLWLSTLKISFVPTKFFWSVSYYLECDSNFSLHCQNYWTTQTNIFVTIHSILNWKLWKCKDTFYFAQYLEDDKYSKSSNLCTYDRGHSPIVVPDELRLLQYWYLVKPWHKSPHTKKFYDSFVLIWLQPCSGGDQAMVKLCQW